MDERPIKRCGCGRSFTRAQWDQLVRLPDWPLDFGVIAEVRNCACGSTILLEGPWGAAGLRRERVAAAIASWPRTS